MKSKKKSSSKRGIALLMALILCVSIGSSKSVVYGAEESFAEAEEYSTYGEEGPTISLFNTYIMSAGFGLTIKSGTANCTTSITGYASLVSKVTIYMYLQKYDAASGSWSFVNTWSQSANDYTTTLAKSVAVTSGKYRLKASFYAISSSGAIENIVKYTGEVTY